MKTLNQVPFSSVEIDNGFWHDRQLLNKTATVQSVYNRFVDTGRFSAFRFDWKEGMPNQPHMFYDSDVAKWIEGAAYILKKEKNAQLEDIIEETVDLIEKNQLSNGYFNIWFTVVSPEKRLTDRTEHELYCAGHLFEAAVAYYEATGKDRFLRCMCKYADFILQFFMKEQNAPFLTPGHEEIELALVRLYHCTGEKKYLELSQWFLDKRGANKLDENRYYEWANERYAQDHLPVREQTTAEGHAVRANYLYCAMADIAYESGDKEMLNACKRIFHNIAGRRMYVTGGVGSSRAGEAFTVDYDLPNATAYAETCAAISLAMFALRMQQLEIDSLYGDIVELELYNGFLVSTSLDGKSFFYENPLEIDLSQRGRDISVSNGESLCITQRVEVFGCSCCPPNILRFVASLGNYLYSHDDETLFIHQYIASSSNIDIGGKAMTVRQKTAYPLDGGVHIIIEGAAGNSVGLRIPGWCRNFTLNAEYTMTGGYAIVKCDSDHMELTLNLNMPSELLEADPRVHADAGRAALRRGPVIYCLEGADNGGAVHDKLVDAATDVRLETYSTFPLPVIKAAGWQTAPTAQNQLYRPLDPKLSPCELTYIPYYTFANRGESDMLVWVPVKR